MDLNHAGKRKQMNKIAARSRNINLAFLASILVVIAATTAMFTEDITGTASTNLVRLHSAETVEHFNSVLSRDLVLVRKVSLSKAVTDWFSDEHDSDKRLAAYHEMKDYAGLLRSANLYFVIDGTLNEFSVEYGASFADFEPFDRINPKDPYNDWYFSCIAAAEDYTLNTDIDKVTGEPYLWINHKVKNGDWVVGVFCSGFPLSMINEELFANYDNPNIKGYVIDKNGVVQLDSGNPTNTGRDVFIGSICDDSALCDAIESHLDGIRSYFNRRTPSEIVRLSQGAYGYASIAPITDTDWSVITLFNDNLLFRFTSLLPLIAAMLTAFLIYATANGLLMQRLVFAPLYRLTRSVSREKPDNGDIFGYDRDDEIGYLARSIREMREDLNTRNEALREANMRSKLWLDAMPLGCNLWNQDCEVFDCNEEAVKMYKLRDKQEYLDKFFQLSVKYGPDGRPAAESCREVIEKAFREGRHVFEWTHQLLDGTPIPTEVTLVRVKNGDELVVAGYMRDLREQKRMLKEIEQRDSLLNTLNHAAILLLRPDSDEFENTLVACMGVIAEAVGIDRVSVWKNHTVDGMLHCFRYYECADIPGQRETSAAPLDISYKKNLPGWEETLSDGQCIHNLAQNFPRNIREFLSLPDSQVVFITPFFYRGQFLGFVRYGRNQTEVLFSENEQSFLRSSGLLLANALLRNEMALSVSAAAAKLEAVIANYSGVIWSVDKDNNITLFNGLYLKKLGLTPGFLEGKNLDTARQNGRHADIVENVEKTFAEGPQDWISEIDGEVFRAHTTPVFDEHGQADGVVGSIDNITEIIRLQAELEAALREAHEANQAKTGFLARMSHEMRTPLNAVIGLSELNLEEEGLSEETRSNLEKINNAGATLLSTVNDILDISKIEAGKFELSPIEYEMPSLINDAVSQSIMYLGEKPVRFVLDISENLPERLYGDELRIKQILNNLLSNAFKYTMSGTVELGLSCCREGETVWLTIRVRDTGIGIMQEDLERLFLEYARMDKEAVRRIQGTGLGLPIVQRIAEMMDGSVKADSEYGKGSVFTVKLRQRFVSDEEIGQDTVNSLKGFRYCDQKRKKNALQPRISLPYARVLVVDDVITNLDVAKGMMKPYGMRIDCVTDGQQAVDAVCNDKIRYSAVFMDHMMPGMDGIEAVRRIRAQGSEYAKTIPIIALTANAVAGNEEMFLQNGFQAFLSKPIEFARLDAIIRQWVRDKELEEEWAGRAEMQPDTLPPQPRFDGRVRGADLQKGLERFGGDAEALLHVLKTYVVNTAKLLQAVKEVTRERLVDYAVTVHGIKGASRVIHANDLGDMAQALEKAAKDGDFGYVESNNPTFIAAAEDLICALEDFLKEIDRANPKPKKAAPDAGALKRLATACFDYDIDAADAAISELETFAYESDDGLIGWLRENLEQMNFEQIKDRLKSL